MSNSSKDSNSGLNSGDSKIEIEYESAKKKPKSTSERPNNKLEDATCNGRDFDKKEENDVCTIKEMKISFNSKHKGSSFIDVLESKKSYCHSFVCKFKQNNETKSNNEKEFYQFLHSKHLYNPEVQDMAAKFIKSNNLLYPPSMISDQFWNYSFPSMENNNYNAKYCGKWMLFIDNKFVVNDLIAANIEAMTSTIGNNNKKSRIGVITQFDQIWYQLTCLMSNNLLGCVGAKCSTNKKNENARQESNCGVIIIYTKDYRDENDCLKVAKNIRKYFPQYKGDIRYKADYQTNQGLYSKNGQKSTLYCHKIDEPNKLFS